MKTTALLGSLLLLPATLCFADIAVYRGAEVVKTTFLNKTDTDVDKFIEVIDLAKSQIVTITLNNTKGKKTFLVGLPVTVVITDVENSHGVHQSSMVLAQAGTTTDSSTGVVTVSSMLQRGVNGQVIISGTAAASLPRNLQGNAFVLTTAGASTVTTPPTPILPELQEMKATLMLRVDDSLTSNNAGDDLTAAVNRIKAGLVAAGFADGSV